MVLCKLRQGLVGNEDGDERKLHVDRQLSWPVDPSRVPRWRKHLGEAGVEERLAETSEVTKRITASENVPVSVVTCQ
ncbi:hypothetical protein [Paraburkholderia sp. JHI869]|uniref:hypothetical protein n=1 Tax=Paraburkholderia sp. JHI869 TaxID=3112959 RepID=UPI00317FA66C